MVLLSGEGMLYWRNSVKVVLVSKHRRQASRPPPFRHLGIQIYCCIFEIGLN